MLSKKKIIILSCVAVALIGTITGCIAIKNRKNAKNDSEISLSTVTRGNVELTISGSGTVEPYERYEIIPLVNGEITSCPYEVGDYIEKGEVVYTFDETDARLSLEKQNNSMKRSTITYNEAMENAEKLTVKSPTSGRIKQLNVTEGDEISANQVIATIIDDVNLKVTVPFNSQQIAYIAKGDTATLSSSSQMSNFAGTVTYVDSTPSAASDGSSVYYVTIEFTNPGAITNGTNLGAQVNGQISPGYGTVSYGEEKQIKAETEGRISKLNIQQGAYVEKDSIVAKLTSETLQNSLEKSRLEYSDAKLNLQSQQDQLDDYSITAPISGTVLTKNSKKGDTIDKTNSSVSMMVIGDVSKLKFSLMVDELDITKVSIGQKVKITSDAVENTEFEGEITNISMEGQASNGVTTYEATVTIDNPGELKPSMNVDAVVVVESAENVTRVPSSDIKTAMGVSYVYVQSDKTSETDTKKQEMPQNERPNLEGGQMPQGERPDLEDGQMPHGERPNLEGGQMPQGERPNLEGGQMPQGERPNLEGGQTSQGEVNKGQRGGMPQNTEDIISRLPAAPEGFEIAVVEIGVQGDDYTEIISGLTVGQKIYKQETSSNGSGAMMGGMAGGMGGGMPGGMGGGMAGGMGGGMAGGMGRR